MIRSVFMNIVAFILISTMTACATVKENRPDERTDKKTDDVIEDNKDFLKADAEAGELFHVLISSDHYIVAQMKYFETIKRVEDPGGDRYIIDEVKRLDKIDETRDGLITLWLYPDSGNIMKVRPQMPTYIVELDRLLTEDIQRWNFEFPKKIVHPTKFNIRYRIVLRKTLSDEEIIKDMQKKIRGD